MAVTSLLLLLVEYVAVHHSSIKEKEISMSPPLVGVVGITIVSADSHGQRPPMNLLYSTTACGFSTDSCPPGARRDLHCTGTGVSSCRVDGTDTTHLSCHCMTFIPSSTVTSRLFPFSNLALASEGTPRRFSRRVPHAPKPSERSREKRAGDV